MTTVDAVGWDLAYRAGMLWLVLVGGIVGGGGALVLHRLFAARGPDLAGVTPSTIAAAADGAVVRLEGKVEAMDDTRDAPLSGVKCVYHERVVRIVHGGGLMALSPRMFGRVVYHGKVGVRFLLRDDTGVAHVEPDGAETDLPVHVQRDGLEGVIGATTAVPYFGDAQHGHQSERVIRPGDKLVVIGRVTREPDPDPRATGSYREGPTRVRLSHAPAAPLHLLAPTSKALRRGAR